MLNTLKRTSTSHAFVSQLLDSDFGAISRALRECGKSLSINKGKSLHSQLIKHGLHKHSVFIANNIMKMYVDLKLHNEAQILFDEMPERNVVSWTSCITSHIDAGNPNDALKAFRHMLINEFVEPNCFTFSVSLKACAMVGNLEMGKWIHNRISEQSHTCFDTVLVNAVIDMYIKCGSLHDARRVFDGSCLLNLNSWNTIIYGYAKAGNMAEAENLFIQVSEPDVVSYNTMITGFAQIDDIKALHFVYLMHRRGYKLDNFTFPCALKVCSSLNSHKQGEQVHNYIIKSGFAFISSIGSSLIDMYLKYGRIEDAKYLFGEYSKRGVYKSDKQSLYDSMVHSLASNGYEKLALDLVAEIHSSGSKLNPFTFSTALKACYNLQNTRIGLQVHGLVFTYGYQSEQIVGSILINLYANYGKLDVSLKLFKNLPNKDLIMWAGIISNCVNQGSNYIAFSLFMDMIRLKSVLDHFIVCSIFKACASLPSLIGGKQVHAISFKIGTDSEHIVLTSLIDMYSKCGNIDDALKIFDTDIKKDIVCWTGMIVGCAQNGRANDAIKIFYDMIESGEKPTNITFLGVLSACRHAGLVEEACNVFNLMRGKKLLVLGLEHFCCMVDILCRDKKFDEARKMIRDMPFKPDENIRNSILSALNEQNAGEIQELIYSLCNASGCTAMSNVYDSLGMFEGPARIREIIRRMGVKEAGKSWVDVGC